MRESNSGKQPIDRLGTSIRMATVVVVVGTLTTVWHPTMRGTTGANAAMSTPVAAVVAPANTETVYFPSHFAAPVNVEPQAPTF